MSSTITNIFNFMTNNASQTFNDLVESAFIFFKLLHQDPQASSPYLLKTFFALLITCLLLFFSYKFIINFVKFTNIFFKEISEICSLFLLSFKSAISNIKNMESLFKTQSWSNFFIWCGGETPPTAQTKEQPILGALVFFVAVWSSISFSYALLTASFSFSEPEPTLFILIPIFSILYGLIIFSFDRGLILPLTSTIHETSLIASIMQLIIRGATAFFIAKFTATAMVILIFNGAITNSIADTDKETTLAIQAKIDVLRQNKLTFIQNKLESRLCKEASENLANHNKLIITTANSGCKPGISSCIGQGTKYLSEKTPAFEAKQTEMCQPTNLEMTRFDDEITSLNKEIDKEKNTHVDILEGSKIINQLNNDQKLQNGFFNPITATYWMFFTIEILPVLLKFLFGLKFLSSKNNDT